MRMALSISRRARSRAGSSACVSTTRRGAFGAPTDLPAQSAGSYTVLHDIDGDGDLDVSAIDEIADRVFVYRQN